MDQKRHPPAPSLPRSARLPINRCNLPAVILGGLSFQRHPVPLELDGVQEMHKALFRVLDGLKYPMDRANRFMDYMTVSFLLESLEEAGLEPGTKRRRANANYLRLLRGWLFDSNGREGAVMKGWAESRFGLLPRFHGEPLGELSGDAYVKYLHDRAKGLYGTNALESQLDLLYTYAQYELTRRHPGQSHITLYRGTNCLDSYEVLAKPARDRRVVLFNSLNSFSDSRERADEFGDYIFEAEVPLSKLFFFSSLLPGVLKGEGEYVVVGGVYEVGVGLI